MSFDHDSEILMYQTEDGQTKIDVRMEDETVWLTQSQMAELFQTTPQNITLHIKNVYTEGELSQVPTCKEYLQVQLDVEKISHKQAKIKAELEYEKYRQKQKDELSKVELDFLESIKETQKLLEGKE